MTQGIRVPTLWNWGNLIAAQLEGWAQLDPGSESDSPEHMPQWAALQHIETGAELHISSTPASSIHARRRLDERIDPTDRFSFSVQWPRMPHPYSNEWVRPSREKDKCTCAASRPPESIAKDVQRKVLDGYLEAWADACQRMSRRMEELDEQYELALRLADVLHTPKGRRPKVEEKGASCYSLYTPAGMYGQVLVRGRDTVEIHRLSLSGELAAQVLELIWKEGNRADL